MKILLSAYACEPGKGSESAIGWNWAIEIARLGHEVWVLTRSNNRENIENGLGRLDPLAGLSFLYYDLPEWARWWKRGERGIHLYYLLWQWGAAHHAARVHGQEHFELVIHITLVSARQPSFLGRLGIPFVFGPAAGGERAPWRLRVGYGWRGQIRDAFRDVSNAAVKLDPMMWQTFRHARDIIVTSDQSRKLVPSRFHDKTRVQLAIGLEKTPGIRTGQNYAQYPYKTLYVGRFVYWKGMHLGLRAFARVLTVIPAAKLTLVGKGPDETRWRKLSRNLGISDHVHWLPWVDQLELPDIYRSHDTLLFPSLHESGGMVVLEAMSHGLPVVCLDIGGPGIMVDNHCGRIVRTRQRSRSEVVGDLASALVLLADDMPLRYRLGAEASVRARQFRWDNIVGNFVSRSRIS